MNEIAVILFVVGGIVLLFLLLGIRKKLRRAQCLKLQFTDAERQELIEDFPTFGRLPESIRLELEGIMHVFMAEKSFEACGGLEEVTGHMRRVVAAEACLLLVNRRHNFYRKLRSILIYPTAYKAQNEHGGEDVRLGESWTSGSVILAWDSVVSGGRNQEDGSNVSIHEFAHQLDQEDGVGDGVPVLVNGRGAYREWAGIFSKAFEKFQRKVEKGRRTVIDSYGATNPAEFFAVATETFYEKPKQLREHYPDVYQQLCNYYHVDPAEWL